MRQIRLFNFPRTPSRTALLVSAVTALSACAQTSGLTPSTPGGSLSTGAAGGTASAQPAFTQFADVPIPQKASMDVKRTHVFGGGEQWIGQLVLSTSHKSADMFDFYKQEMPGFGWRELTSIRGETSVMAYIRDGRVATIRIESATIQGSEVLLTVSPEESGASNGGGGSPPPTGTIRR
ncbi:MAG: hypothetical protein OQJ99_10805 [Rhodospirillales bacterium]|nr:hypothetical protein [Rhodospirillales bacterium]MCW8861649.1 hypothetical protein [Rhodospirillales bacterium]MCW8969646.1 hypothetical protein [Rhodospirillales bacterium]MCW9002864.1 hypothetical protein [Rhodospirillales bacterium]